MPPNDAAWLITGGMISPLCQLHSRLVLVTTGTRITRLLAPRLELAFSSAGEKTIMVIVLAILQGWTAMDELVRNPCVHCLLGSYMESRAR
jgi:hypothetical protein